MTALTSDKLVIDECLAPGLATMETSVAAPVLSNCTGELATSMPLWYVGAEATLLALDHPPFFLPMPPWLQQMPLSGPICDGDRVAVVEGKGWKILSNTLRGEREAGRLSLR